MVQANVSMPYASMRTFRIEQGDLVVVRAGADGCVSRWAEQLVRAMKAANPKWQGTVIVLKVDEELSILPEHKAREVYNRLKSQFEPNRPRRRRRR
jgi:hypothetical protein